MLNQISKRKQILMIICIVLSSLIVILFSLLMCIRFYKNPANKKLEKAGIVEKQMQVGEVLFNYAEGPDNGTPLVLLHAQLLDWYSYSEVLPELSKKYHVYAIDYPGHGKTIVPENYEFSANQIGTDLANFIKTIIREPIYISGNSSGGLLSLWLAVNNKDYVKKVLLEDPPLFSAEYPEIIDTIAYKSFATSNTAITNGYDDDFLMYWINNSTKFFQTYTGPFGQSLIRFMVKQYRSQNPDAPIELAFLPSVVKEMIRGLDYYNPAFGNAFYEGTWNSGFDHAEALSEVECPVLLLQAEFDYTEEGILNGAMSEEMANKAQLLITDCTYVRVDSNHIVNLDKPQRFIDVLESFFK